MRHTKSSSPGNASSNNFASPTFRTSYEWVGNAEAVIDEKRNKPRIRRWIRRTVLISVAIVVIVGGVFGYELYSEASKLTNQSSPFSLFTSLLPQSPKETNGRVNILFAGYSVGDPHHQGAQLTDSIMIISINPKTKSGVLLSVPRDLWIHIPGNGQSKINAAYEDGQAENFNEPGYFLGGMGLLEKVVSQRFGVKFDYYALINYAALRDAVNAVGGITININSPDPRGIYDPYTHLKLPNGKVHLNGQQALDLARTRGDGPGSYGIPNYDFTRTQYQQKMIVAIKDKASSLSSFVNPITVLKLVNAVGNNVKTDLKIGQMESLYSDVKGISNGSIKEVTLNNYNGHNLLANHYIDGQDALIPADGLGNYGAIKTAVNNLLYGN